MRPPSNWPSACMSASRTAKTSASWPRARKTQVRPSTVATSTGLTPTAWCRSSANRWPTPRGEVTRPFRTQYGWHVLEVLGRRATDSTEQAREQQALSVLRNRKYDEELQTWLRQIRDEAYVEIKLPGADQAAQ